MELVAPVAVAVVTAVGSTAEADSGSDSVTAGVDMVKKAGLLGSSSSGLENPSCCTNPPQLALFSPRWPSMVWDRRVSENRPHSANKGSTTYVMKPRKEERDRETHRVIDAGLREPLVYINVL